MKKEEENKKREKSSKKAQWVKALAVKPDGLSLIPRTHKLEVAI